MVGGDNDVNRKTGSEEEWGLEVYRDRRKLHMSAYLQDVHLAFKYNDVRSNTTMIR